MILGPDCVDRSELFTAHFQKASATLIYLNAQFLSIQSTPTVLSGQRQERPPGVAKQR